MNPNEREAYIIQAKVLIERLAQDLGDEVLRLARVAAIFEGRYGPDDPQRKNAIACMQRAMYDQRALRVFSETVYYAKETPTDV